MHSGLLEVENLQKDDQVEMKIGKIKTSVDDSYLFRTFLSSLNSL